MKNEVSMGINRTGAKMAPFNTEDVESFARSRLGEGRRDGLEYAALHVDYMHEADSVGSVPIPGTAKGVASTVVSALKGDKPSVLIDQLGERLAFERTGVRLYEALITKWSALGDEEQMATPDLDEAQLREILAEEEAHFRLLTEVITKMGADPTAMTPAADVAGVSAMGWLQVINDPRTSMSQALTTMLSAELADDAGWELLIQLASSAGHRDIAELFSEAEQAEHRHVERVRGWLSGSVLREAS